MRLTTTLTALIVMAGLGCASPVRVAIVADPKLDSLTKTAVIDALSTLPNVTLADREAVAKSAVELEFAMLLKTDAVRTRVELGCKLDADAIVLLVSDPGIQTGSGRVQLVIADGRLGVRLAQAEFARPLDTKRLGQRSRELLESVCQRFEGGIKSIVAVAPLRSGNLSYESDYLQGALAEIIRARMLQATGVAVLEVGELLAIQREAPECGSTKKELPVSLIIEGEFRSEPRDGRTGFELQLECTRADGKESIERTFVDEQAAILFLQNEFAPKLASEAALIENPLALDEQTERLAELADQFRKDGQFARAAGVREAALLINPELGDQRIAAISDYATSAGLMQFVNWGIYSRAEGEKLLHNCSINYRRALTHLIRAVEKKQITRAEAVAAWRTANDSFRAMIFHVGVDTYTGLNDAVLIRKFREHLADCVALRRVFLTGSARAILDLPLGDPKVLDSPPPYGSNEVVGQRNRAGTRTEERVFDLWQRCLAEYPVEQKDALSVTLQERLAHAAWCLTGPLTDQQRIFALGAFETAILNANSRAQTSEKELKDRIDTLLKSESKTAKIHGELYNLLLPAAFGENGQPVSAQAIGERLDRWAVEAEQQRLVAARSTVAQLKRRVSSGDGDSVAQGQAPTARLVDAPADAPVLNLEPVEFSVTSASGETMPFRRWYERWDCFYTFTRAGSVDYAWNCQFLLLHESPGKLREIHDVAQREHPGIRDVVFDGQNTWIITCCAGVRVYDQTGQLIAHRPVDESLPAAHFGAKLAVIDTGSVLAVGSVAKGGRGWCAVLQLADGTIRSNVIHEATTSYESGGSLTDAMGDAKASFKPLAVHRDGASAAPRFYVSRELFASDRGPQMFRPPFLLVDVEKKSSAIVDFQLPRPTNTSAAPALAFTADGCVYVDRDEVRLAGCPDAPTRRDATILDARDQSLAPNFTPHQGGLIVCGKTWYRIDPAKLQATVFGAMPSNAPAMGNRTELIDSAHFGLFLWDDQLHFFKIGGTTSADQAKAEDDARIAELRDRVASDPANSLAHKNLVHALYKANRPELALTACMAWIRAMPRQMEARFALRDVERQARNGLGPWDNPPSLARSSFPSYAIWRLHNDAATDTGAAGRLMSALKLPIAIDQDEWFIAEIGLASDAAHCADSNRPADAIMICERWEREANNRGADVDRSYHLVRALAYLRMDKAVEARQHLTLAEQAEARGECWIRGAAELSQAIARGDNKFRLNAYADIYDRRVWWEMK